MTTMPQYHSTSGGATEGLFIDLFINDFGVKKIGPLYSQY